MTPACKWCQDGMQEICGHHPDRTVRCEKCGANGAAPPTRGWLGRHAHGTKAATYRERWATRAEA